jgi:hypothetical protein
MAAFGVSPILYYILTCLPLRDTGVKRFSILEFFAIVLEPITILFQASLIVMTLKFIDIFADWLTHVSCSTHQEARFTHRFGTLLFGKSIGLLCVLRDTNLPLAIRLSFIPAYVISIIKLTFHSAVIKLRVLAQAYATHKLLWPIANVVKWAVGPPECRQATRLRLRKQHRYSTYRRS